MAQSEDYTPSHSGTMVYFPADDIDKVLAKVGEKGVRTLNPKMDIGEHGFIAHFEDSEGIRVGLHAMP